MHKNAHISTLNFENCSRDNASDPHYNAPLPPYRTNNLHPILKPLALFLPISGSTLINFIRRVKLYVFYSPKHNGQVRR